MNTSEEFVANDAAITAPRKVSHFNTMFVTDHEALAVPRDRARHEQYGMNCVVNYKGGVSA